MNWRALAKLFGFFSCIIAGLMAISAGLSFLYQEKETLWLGLSALVPLFCGLGLMQISWEEDVEDLSHRESTLLIAVSWLLAILWGAFPYYLSKVFGDFSFLSFLNSLFESTAGFTGTAASVLVPITTLKTLPHGLLFWRSLSQWLGGLGIILTALFFLPFIRAGGMELWQHSLIARERLRRRVGETSRTVLAIYVGLTALAVLSLKLAGMDFFDAFCHSFTTVSSGGLSTRTNNIMAFDSIAIEWVLIVFMILSTTNFTLHYSFVKGHWSAYWKSAELRFYLGVLLIATLLIGWNLKSAGNGMGWREAIFNTVSIGSTTGFWSADFSVWPHFSKALLMLMMFVGGMAGSPAGAIKCFRAILLIKFAYRQVFRMIHPSGFTPVKIEGRVVEREILDGVAAFFILYILFFAAGSFILQGLGYDMMLATSSIASALGGVGPAFHQSGVLGGYYYFPVSGKLTLMACMVLGRAEIFPILMVLSREFWRK